MKDIPVFTTEYGIASLMLREIPYRGEAYIRVRSCEPENLGALLEECRGFCRMAGADKIYATAETMPEGWSLHASVIRMQGTARVDQDELENLFPVTEQTVAHWRQICNASMREVSCAATQTAADEKRILESGGAYFVHRQGELLGIGWLLDGELAVLCSVIPGEGRHVLNTLLSLVEGSSVTLEVASTNYRAIRLYEKMGFLRTAELTRWYSPAE